MRSPLVVALALIAACIARHGAAQGFDMAKGGASEIEIYADDGLEWQSDESRVIAHGNAKAVRGDVTVTADTLTAYYRSANSGAADTKPAANKGAAAKPPAAKTPGDSGAAQGGSQIWRLDADGNVTISTATDIATGYKAVYDMDKALLVLHGHPALLNTPTESYSADDELEYWENERMAVLRGNAVATGKDKKIQADVLTAHFKDKAASKSASGASGAKPQPAPKAAGDGKAKGGGTSAEGSMDLAHADAYGHVIITTPQDVVTGDRGDYNPDTGIATVSGAVKLTRQGNELNGRFAHVDMNTGISTLYGNLAGDQAGKGRVDGTFTPSRDSSEQRPALFRGHVGSKSDQNASTGDGAAAKIPGSGQ